MTTTAWLAVAAALVVTVGPSPALTRTSGLGGQGRLATPADRRSPGARLGVRRGDAVVTVGALVACLVSCLVVGVVLGIGGPVLAVAAAAIVGTVVLLARDLARRRSSLAGHRVLLAALRILVAELEAGSRPDVAFAAAATAGDQVREVFTRAADAAAAGQLSGVLDGDPRPAVRSVGLAWRLGQDTGVALAGVLERVAIDLAAADGQRRAVAVALAGPRSSAVLLSLLPTLGIALGTAMGASPVALLTGQPSGRILCLAGVLLDVGGVLWIRAILRRAEQS